MEDMESRSSSVTFEQGFTFDTGRVKIRITLCRNLSMRQVNFVFNDSSPLQCKQLFNFLLTEDEQNTMPSREIRIKRGDMTLDSLDAFAAAERYNLH